MGKCSSCGSSSPVLETAPLDSDGCATCGTCNTCNLPSASCGCTKSPCQENHTQVIISKKYAFTLRTFDTLTWPAKNESTSFRVDSVERIAVGTILYYPPAGYLHVTGFDCVTQIVTVKNLGETCNVYTGGEQLPPCTDFAVGPPTCVPGSAPIPNIPYLAADFISPAESECALASVTNITGLTIGDVISIFGYQYRIGDILDSDTIQLCNDGDGATEGTVIEWDEDGDEVPNVPVVVISSENPCTRDSISAGLILACDGETAKPIEGSVSGQILVWNQLTERFELKSISAPFTVCTALTADFTVTAGDPGPYTIIVADTDPFAEDDSIIIDGLYYTVNAVGPGLSLNITAVADPVALAVYGTGTAVCLNTSSGRVDANSNEVVTPGPDNFVADEGAVTYGPCDVTISNTSPTQPMKVMVTFDFKSQYSANAQSGFMDTDLQLSIDGGGFNTLATNFDSSLSTELWSIGKEISYSEVYTIAPGDDLDLSLQAIVTCLSGETPPAYTAANSILRVSYIAVAV